MSSVFTWPYVHLVWFGLRKDEAATVRAYIREQPRHHREGTLVDPWEATLPGEIQDE